MMLTSSASGAFCICETVGGSDSGRVLRSGRFSHGASSARSNASATSSGLVLVFACGLGQIPVQPWTVWPGGRSPLISASPQTA